MPPRRISPAPPPEPPHVRAWRERVRKASGVLRAGLGGPAGDGVVCVGKGGGGRLCLCVWGGEGVEGGQVLEVRTADGYGAQWSADGAAFRGFLEPQMPDGHAVGWRH